jgi:polysaccharide pyruvyl transferase WcaK-like protein
MENYSFISIKTQFDNLGDALIVRELLKKLNERSVVFVDLSRCPENFIKAIDIGSMEKVIIVDSIRHLFKEIIHKSFLNETTLSYFFIPGGFNGEITKKDYYKGKLVNLIMRILKVFGLKFYQLGISYEQIGSLHQKLIISRSSLMERISVRDFLSFQFISKISVNNKYTIVPDLAYNLFKSEQKVFLEYNRDSIAFAFRIDKYKRSEKVNFEEIINFIDSTILLFSDNKKIKLIVQVARDLGFMTKVLHFLEDKYPEKVMLIDCGLDINRAIYEYSKCQILFSNRLHSLLLSASANCLPVAVIDNKLDKKIVGIYQDSNNHKLLLNFNENFNCKEEKYFTIGEEPARLDDYFKDIFTVLV